MNRHTLFHLGEQKVQQLANETPIALRNGSIIRNTIITGAMPFIAQQNMVVLSSLDNQGKVWASVLIGNAGFISAPDASSLIIDTKKVVTHPGELFWQNIKSNPQVGVLAIDLSTRKRFRINGAISQLDEERFEIKVKQAFPNCLKYIQHRSLTITAPDKPSDIPSPLAGSGLTPEHIEMIQNADSLFVGSSNPINNQIEGTDKNQNDNQITQQGCDASHRGGFPGFVEVIDGRRLRIPDYRGNSLFNTLGNIEVYPFAGIAFIDFENSKILQISGQAEILWDQDDPTEKSGGTRRFWELSVEAWRETKIPETINWNFFEYSPYNPSETRA